MDKLLIKKLKKNINKTPLKSSYNFTYKTQKYKLEDILNHILIILKKGFVWRDLDLIKNIKWNTVYKHFKKLSKYNIFKDTYSDLLKLYFYKTPSKKLKIIDTDTTVISNKNGSEKVGKNKLYKNKKVTKLSVITDNNKIPILANIYSGNIYDSKILLDQLQNNQFIINNILIKKIKFIVADKGYDSKQLKEFIKNKYNSILITPQNRRNIKNPLLIRSLTPEYKKMYNNRVKIENFFGTLKRSFKRITERYDKKSYIFESFIFFAFCNLIIKHL
jgi:hypothetical protein